MKKQENYNSSTFKNNSVDVLNKKFKKEGVVDSVVKWGKNVDDKILQKEKKVINAVKETGSKVVNRLKKDLSPGEIKRASGNVYRAFRDQVKDQVGLN